MKKDLITAIAAAVAGVVISYLICNLLVGMLSTEDYSFKYIDTTISSDISEPDKEVFNYRSLNPTVEVYIGDCDNESGECEDSSTGQIDDSFMDDIESSNDEESSETESSSDAEDESESSSSNASNQRNR